MKNNLETRLQKLWSGRVTGQAEATLLPMQLMGTCTHMSWFLLHFKITVSFLKNDDLCYI